MSFRNKLKQFFLDVSGLSLPKEHHRIVFPPTPNWNIEDVKKVLADVKITAYVSPIKNDKSCFSIKSLTEPPNSFKYKNQEWKIKKKIGKKRLAICYLNNLPFSGSDEIIDKYINLTGEKYEIRKIIKDKFTVSCSISFTKIFDKASLYLKKVPFAEGNYFYIRWKAYVYKEKKCFIKERKRKNNSKPKKPLNQPNSLIYVKKPIDIEKLSTYEKIKSKLYVWKVKQVQDTDLMEISEDNNETPISLLTNSLPDIPDTSSPSNLEGTSQSNTLQQNPTCVIFVSPDRGPPPSKIRKLESPYQIHSDRNLASAGSQSP